MVLLCEGYVQYIVLRNLYTSMDPSVLQLSHYVGIQDAERSCNFHVKQRYRHMIDLPPAESLS